MQTPFRPAVGSLWFLGALYALLAIVLLAFPNELVYLINVGPKVFGLTEAMPDPVDRFFSIQASGLAATLSALTFLSAESPRATAFPLVHLLSKVVTLSGFLYMYLNQKPYFAYAVAFVLEIGATGIVLWHLLRIPRWNRKEAMLDPTPAEPPPPSEPSSSEGPSL